MLASALIAASSAPGLSLPGVKYKTTGTYVDGSGGQHSWSVNDGHTLIWRNEPFVPVGGAFASRYIALEPTDENYQADTAALEAIRARGITDIILKSNGPATATDPAAWQRIIDYLDANGFTYGIELNDGPKDPLRGYLISPSRYRLEGPSSETTIACNWPDVDSAIYVIVNRTDNSIETIGGAAVRDGKVIMELPRPLSASQVMIAYPHKTFKPAAEGGIGDMWGGFSEYRDRVCGFLKGIKFGPGLRFFLEPFTSKMDFTGEMAWFLPDSAGFRLGLEAYLTKIHVHEGSVNAKWGLNDNLESIEVAARLMPMWASGRGLPYVYDRASAHRYSVDWTVTQMWWDIIKYRNSSAQEYMNMIADALGKQVADVPVIFKGSTHHSIYANPYGMSGFDGLGVAVGGIGESVAKSAGPVYSLAEESGKSMWYIVAATNAAADRSSPASYPSESAMLASLDTFREIGCKGFFVDGLQSLSGEAGACDLAANPEQLDWLRKFKDRIKAGSLADFKPTVVRYPMTPHTGAHVKRLAPNTWWLPSLASGSTSFIGDGLGAYTMAGEGKTYLWSGTGPRTVSIKPGPTGVPIAEFPESLKITKNKSGTFSIALSDIPTVLRGMDFALFFPYETASAEIETLAKTIPLADKAGMNVQQARSILSRAKTVLEKGQPLIAYGMAQTSMQELMRVMGADIWIEGEQSPANNFDGIEPVAGASNNLALVLDTYDDPPLSPYIASYAVHIESDASYEIWIAGTPPSEASSVSYTVDDSGWTPVSGEGSRSEGYAQGLGWHRIGTANLVRGRHTLKLKVDSRRSQDGRFFYAIDAIVLSPKGFRPNGVVKSY